MAFRAIVMYTIQRRIYLSCKKRLLHFCSSQKMLLESRVWGRDCGPKGHAGEKSFWKVASTSLFPLWLRLPWWSRSVSFTSDSVYEETFQERTNSQWEMSRNRGQDIQDMYLCRSDKDWRLKVKRRLERWRVTRVSALTKSLFKVLQVLQTFSALRGGEQPASATPSMKTSGVSQVFWQENSAQLEIAQAAPR